MNNYSNDIPLASLKKILIIRLRNLGDILLSTPLLRAVRGNCKQAKIAFLLEQPYEQMLRFNPNVDYIIKFDRERVKKLPTLLGIKYYLKFLQRLRRERFDLVIDLFGNPRSAIMTLATCATYRVGFKYRGRSLCYNIKVDCDYSLWAGDFLLQPAYRLSMFVEDNGLDFWISPDDEQFAKEFLHTNNIGESDVVVGLCVCGTWQAKRWLPENFAQLAENLQKILKVKVLFIAGRHERQQIHEITKMMSTDVITAFDLPLKSVGAIIKNLRLLITNDTAIRYIAIALDTPTLTFYGPTDHRSALPPNSKKHKILRVNLPCSPCHKLTCKAHTCMRAITPEDVLKVAKHFLTHGEWI